MNQNSFYNQNNEVEYVSDNSLATQQSLILRVFVWMAMGLGITGLTAMLTYNSGLFYTLVQNQGIFWGLMIAEIGMVWYLSARIMKLSFTTATVLFGTYAVLNGLTLSMIFAIYTMSSIATTFFVTAGTFGAMALYGYYTKRDLSKLGSLLMMALIGLIIASVVNIFLGNSMLDLVISAVGVLIFVGLTAWDTQSIKQMLAQTEGEDEELVKKLSVLGALSLYLDFINLFLYLLRFLGSRD